MELMALGCAKANRVRGNRMGAKVCIVCLEVKGTGRGRQPVTRSKRGKYIHVPCWCETLGYTGMNH